MTLRDRSMRNQPARSTGRLPPLRKRRRAAHSRFRTLLAESLEPRTLLAASDPAMLLYLGIAREGDVRSDADSSATNAGLIAVADLVRGVAAPWRASFQEPATEGSSLASRGVSGLAFDDQGSLLVTIDASAASPSELLRLDPHSGDALSRNAVKHGNVALHIDDLAWNPVEHQLYGISSSEGQVRLYVINTDRADALPVATPSAISGWSRGTGLAFALGTMYATGVAEDGLPVLFAQNQPTVRLSQSIVGLAALPGAIGADDVLFAWTSGGTQPVRITPGTGVIESVTMQGPTRGVAGDLDFSPNAWRQVLQPVYSEDFASSSGGFVADNSGGPSPGLWHLSLGRWNDGQISHTPMYGWYYGAFETSTGGGNYILPHPHQGILNSPAIELPECGLSVLSFDYSLDTRDELDHDQVTVLVEYENDFGQRVTDRVLSRSDGTLPQTKGKWLTATADLSRYAGRTITVRFSFNTVDTDNSDPDGWYVDDVQVWQYTASACGYKWNDLTPDGKWDADEPGLGGWTIYADLNANETLDSATASHGYSSIDANSYFPGRPLSDPAGISRITTAAATVIAAADPYHAGRQLFARGTNPSDAVWQGQVLRVDFAQFMQTVAIDFASPDKNESATALIRVYGVDDLLETLELPVEHAWTTLTVTRPTSDILYIEASRAATSDQPVLINALHAWGTIASDAAEPSSVSRDDGFYQLFDLPPVKTWIREVAKPGWLQTYPGGGHQVVVVPGEPVIGNIFQTEPPNFGNGVTGTAVVRGRKWEDVNGNGQREAGEPGLPDWLIYADLNHNAQLDSGEPFTRTAADGTYSLDVSAPGEFHIREEPQAGWQFTYPLSAEYVLWVSRGQTVDGVDFGTAVTGSIHGFAFDDRDKDGQYDKGIDLPLPGVQFLLTGTTGLGMSVSLVGTSNDLGEIWFTGLMPSVLGAGPGTGYTLTVNGVPSEYDTGKHFQWTGDLCSRDELVWLEGAAHLHADALQHEHRRDLAFDFIYRFGSISGFKFEDKNGNGNWDESADPNLNENGLKDWTICWINGAKHECTVTDEDGEYQFVDLSPGDYLLCEIFQSGWRYTTAAPKVIHLQSGQHYVGTPAQGPGTVWPGLLFGNRRVTVGDELGSVRGYLFEDMDGDGQWDATEPPRKGVDVYLDYPIGDDCEISGQSSSYKTTTLSGGQFAFVDLPTGKYKLRVETQGDWTVTTSEPVCMNVEVGVDVVAERGQASLPNDTTRTEIIRPELMVGMFQLGSIHGHVFEDLDEDGVEDPGEPRIPGRTIYLDVNLNSQWDEGIREAFTDENGQYRFDQLDHGAYRVRAASQDGWKQTSLNPATVVLLSGQEYVSTSGEAQLPIGSTKDEILWSGLAFGIATDITVQFITPMSVYRTDGPFAYPAITNVIEGHVWHDSNQNGQWDSGEYGLDGVVVELIDEVTGVVALTQVTRSVDLDGSGTDGIDNDGDTQIDELDECIDPYSESGVYWFDKKSMLGVTDAWPANFRVRVALPDNQQTTYPTGNNHSLSGINAERVTEPGNTVHGRANETEPPNFGLSTDFVNNPPTNCGTIIGYKWHDVDQDGVWDAGEVGREGWQLYLETNDDNDPNKNGQFDPDVPFAVTDSTGRYVFSNVPSGRYTIREDNTDLSDGTFVIQKYPSLRQHEVTLSAGQVLAGAYGSAQVPNFGGFEYSPFIRPADDYFGHLDLNRDGALSASESANELITALTNWQLFKITNTTGSPLQITSVEKVIDTSIVPDAADLVRVLRRNSDGSCTAFAPFDLADGETAQFCVFYDPAIRSADGSTVLRQYPDWYTGQPLPHTFQTGDHLSVRTNTNLVFNVGLVGASTYDSDIIYDGHVDSLDVRRLDDILLDANPLPILADDKAFDPTSDVDARCPNDGIHRTCTWAIDGTPPRQIGLEDFAPINVEYKNSTAPFLDLAPSTAGVSTITEISETQPNVAPSARFANSIALELVTLVVSIENPADRGYEYLSLGEQQGTTLFIKGTTNTIEEFNRLLGQIRYTNSSPSRTGSSRTVYFRAIGGSDFDNQLGNEARATIRFT